MLTLTAAQLADVGAKKSERETSPSTRSSLGATDRSSSEDEIDVSDASSSMAAQEVVIDDSSKVKACILPLPLGLNVNNTFHDMGVSMNSDRENIEAPHARQRAMSAPFDPFEEALHPSSPRASLGAQYEVLSGPVKACTMRFLRTLSEESKEAVTELLENCLTPDVALQVESCINDACTGIASLQGSDEVVNFPARLRDAIPDITFSLEDVVNERRNGTHTVALARVTCSGTQRYPFLPMIPSGMHVSFALHMETLEKVGERASRLRWNFGLMNPVLKLVKELSMQATGTTNGALSLADAAEVVETEALDVVKGQTVTTMQPVLCVGLVPITMGYANADSFARPAAALHQSSSRTQTLDVQRTQLAAAALRAQAQLEALENRRPPKGAGKSSRPKQVQPTERPQLTAAKASKPMGWQTPQKQTTLMLRNMPLDLTRTKLLMLLDSEGFALKYDFVYLPMDYVRSANLGYAFVNLLSHDVALQMQQHFEGFCRWGIRCQKKCAPVWAATHGLDAYIALYRNNPVMHESVPEESKPVLFVDGVRVEFPASTRKIKPPRPNPNLNSSR
jgi:predicted ester cyclase